MSTDHRMVEQKCCCGAADATEATDGMEGPKHRKRRQRLNVRKDLGARVRVSAPRHQILFGAGGMVI